MLKIKWRKDYDLDRISTHSFVRLFNQNIYGYIGYKCIRCHISAENDPATDFFSLKENCNKQVLTCNEFILKSML
jgi:hypothetical protein